MTVKVAVFSMAAPATAMSMKPMLGSARQSPSNGARHSVTLRECSMSVVYQQGLRALGLTGIKR
jgi:hypothetical protein